MEDLDFTLDDDRCSASKMKKSKKPAQKKKCSKKLVGRSASKTSTKTEKKTSMSAATTKTASKITKKESAQQELAEEFFKEIEDLARTAGEQENGKSVRLRPRGTIRLGSDCAGIGSDFVSLRLSVEDGVRIKNKFVAEMDENKLQWLKAIESHLGDSTPDIIYKDVMQRDNEHAPDVDILMSGAPCPPFSSAGKRGGMADARGWLLLSSVKYAIVKRPPVFGLENVKGLASRGNKWILKRIQRILKLAGYKCYCAQMDTREHGVPQSRPRIYLIALLVKHLHPDRPFSFPEPIPQPRLKRFLVNTGKFEKKTKLSKGPLANVRRAILAVEMVYLYLYLYLYKYLYINI